MSWGVFLLSFYHTVANKTVSSYVLFCLGLSLACGSLCPVTPCVHALYGSVGAGCRGFRLFWSPPRPLRGICHLPAPLDCRSCRSSLPASAEWKGVASPVAALWLLGAPYLRSGSRHGGGFGPCYRCSPLPLLGHQARFHRAGLSRLPTWCRQQRVVVFLFALFYRCPCGGIVGTRSSASHRPSL